MKAASLNAVYSKAAMRRRYEVWFLRLGLADGSGAWWFRYLLLNPGRPGGGCAGQPGGEPVQVWATWFPRDAEPQSFIQGFRRDTLALSPPAAAPFRLEHGANRIGEDACAGSIEADGHTVGWELRYRSRFGATLADWGWIGFSRTAHSDAAFSGRITLDGRTVSGEPLGFGLQGHNCGFRYRHLWSWSHSYFHHADGSASTFEALEYEIPLGLRVQRALLWHRGHSWRFTRFDQLLRDREQLQWSLKCADPRNGLTAAMVVDGGGPSRHRLTYRQTDCVRTFPVTNNSRARATLYLAQPDAPTQELRTDGGAVLEMVGG